MRMSSLMNMPRRRVMRRPARTIMATLALVFASVALAACGSDEAQAPDRQAATYRGTKVTVINSSASPVQAKVYGAKSRHVPYTEVPPGGRHVGAGEGGSVNGGSATTSLSWDEDVVTRRLALVTSNTVTGNGLNVYAYDMTPNGDITKRTIRVAEPAAYDGDTSFEYDGHTIKVDRQGYNSDYYLWDIIIQR